ncbi:MAG: UvrD-helicase domain-containing protein, partial [Deltaproteobacteria bacterium]|nr:UvrD-helicase domain-containing protein [Deltaproteobacteria bacterium]
GLFKLKDELARQCDLHVPPFCRQPVRFMLVTEISNIYKKNGKTRKNHNLVFVPDLDIAQRFSAKLDQIGNIKSDGRPILGLDARDLLETLMATSDRAFLIPAHIWTPWFSVLGSKSGFDSLEECFEDLTPYIFAAETGLSSDPAMNWRVSFLDGLTLVSNSDAHSPLNLGREANVFDTELSYSAIKAALKTGDPDQFLGTFEFYPEEGKYHIDGHRACKISFWPADTLKHSGLCPECGKALTLGVLYRVEELADRMEGHKPEKIHPYTSSIQLVDILSEVLRVGPASKKVKQAYQNALYKLGSEFDILHALDIDAIEQAAIPLLGEAIARMRRKDVNVIPGYDGEYGRVRIFKDQERQKLLGQQSLFALSMPEPPAAKPEAKRKPKSPSPKTTAPTEGKLKKSQPAPADLFSQLNEQQRRAVEYPDGALLIVAGPGTGKTRTLTMRIAHLIMRKDVSPDNILAVTFTRRAAREMQQRLRFILGDTRKLPLVATLHALCFKILNAQNAEGVESIIDEDDRKVLIREAIKQVKNQGIAVSQKPQLLLDRIITAKQKILKPDDLNRADIITADARTLAEVYHSYQNLLSIQGLNDYEDLIFKVVQLLETNEKVCEQYRRQFQHVFVDEYQDLNHGQYRILRALAPAKTSNRNLCVIGDPDQSIYGFRGSDASYFTRFTDDYPESEVIELTRNYRSTATIVDASFQVIQDHRLYATNARTYSQMDGDKTISIIELASGKAEALAIARIVAQLVGGTGFHSVDTGQVADANLVSARSYADFAVLARTNQQLKIIGDVFEQDGIPFQIATRQHSLKRWGLAELISLLSVVEGYGSDVDLDNCLGLFSAGLNKKAVDHFKSWCYSKKFSQQQGFTNARRFPIHGLSRTQQQKLNDFAAKITGIKNETAAMKVAEKLQYLAKMTQLTALVNAAPQSQDAFKNLLGLSKDFGDNTVDFLAHAALHTDTDAYLPLAEKVALMSMHAAKGLEFPVVFIAGCEDELIPLKRDASKHEEPVDVAEERRLFYVAMTRAMETLYLTRAKHRSVYGKRLSRSPSPFLADIENRFLKDESPRVKKKKASVQRQLELF